MNYQRFHRFLLAFGFCATIGVAVGAAFFLDVEVQAGAVAMILALLWIGWELHRLATLVKNFMEGFVEGYLESTQAKGN